MQVLNLALLIFSSQALGPLAVANLAGGYRGPVFDTFQKGHFIGDSSKKYFPEVYKDFPAYTDSEFHRSQTNVISKVTIKAPFEKLIEFYQKYFISKKGTYGANAYQTKNRYSVVYKRTENDGMYPDDVYLEIIKNGDTCTVELSSNKGLKNKPIK